MKKAFTLAEVLITLVIIGVIAAMTIPTLMKNTQKQEFVTGLKKANSTLQQAMINIANNNDAPPGDFSFLNKVNLMDEMPKVLNVIKKCTTREECFGNDYASVYNSLNSTGHYIGSGKGIITSDGMIYWFSAWTSGHGQTEEDSANTLGYIVVDINGSKGPNIWGRDVFLFDLISNKGLIPAGSNSSASCATNSTGFSCAARVLKENAMNY